MSSSLIIAPEFSPVRTIAISPLQVESSPTSVALPITEPATSQLIYTIQASDFTSIVAGDFTSVGWWAFLLMAGGRNTSGVSRGVSYRVLKNGTSVAASSASVANNNYYTVSAYQFGSVVAGDVCEIRLWADGTGCNYDYFGYALQPSRINVVNTYVQAEITQIQSPNFITGVLPSLTSTGPLILYPGNSLISSALNTPSGAAVQGFFNTSLAGFGLYRTTNGDSSQGATIQVSSTSRPRYLTNRIASSIKYRGFLGQLTL